MSDSTYNDLLAQLQSDQPPKKTAPKKKPNVRRFEMATTGLDKEQYSRDAVAALIGFVVSAFTSYLLGTSTGLSVRISQGLLEKRIAQFLTARKEDGLDTPTDGEALCDVFDETVRNSIDVVVNDDTIPKHIIEPVKLDEMAAIVAMAFTVARTLPPDLDEDRVTTILASMTLAGMERLPGRTEPALIKLTGTMIQAIQEKISNEGVDLDSLTNIFSEDNDDG